MSSGVTVVITAIPPRRVQLQRAMASVTAQTLFPDAVALAFDNDKRGAPYCRDAALAQVQTEFVAFLDDDDEFYPKHIEALVRTLNETGADMVYPWFDVQGGLDPFPQFEGLPWDNAEPHQIPVTFLARTSTMRAVGGFSYGWDDIDPNDPGVDGYGNRAGEDYALTLRVVESGFRIQHLNERTWRWHHHANNTSGLPSRW